MDKVALKILLQVASLRDCFKSQKDETADEATAIISFSTKSLGDEGFLWVCALPGHQLSRGISHPHQGSGVGVSPPDSCGVGQIKEPFPDADVLQP